MYCYVLGCPPQDAIGKWRFRLGSPRNWWWLLLGRRTTQARLDYHGGYALIRGVYDFSNSGRGSPTTWVWDELWDACAEKGTVFCNSCTQYMFNGHMNDYTRFNWILHWMNTCWNSSYECQLDMFWCRTCVFPFTVVHRKRICHVWLLLWSEDMLHPR